MKNEETKRQPVRADWHFCIHPSSFCISPSSLVDARGNVVGIVAAKLDASAALAATGSLPENVNYAVKSSLLLSFLESVPDVAAKLKEPDAKDESFEEVVKSAQDAAVLILVYGVFANGHPLPRKSAEGTKKQSACLRLIN